MKNIFKTITAVAAVAGLSVLASSASANTVLTIGLGSTPDSLGDIHPGVSNAGGQANAATADVTEILTLALNGTTTIGSAVYNRSGNTFSPLPAPTATGADTGESGTEFTLTGTYTYLVAKYGNNEMVWDIASLPVGTVIDIPANGTGSPFGQEGSGLSDETLLNPDPTTNVPDSASTLGLLGLAASGLMAVRRKMN